MVISNLATPSYTSFKAPSPEESSKAVADKLIKEEEVAKDITGVRREETLSQIAENGEILQKSSKNIEI